MNEQRRSKNCGWRNMPPRRGLVVWRRAGYKDVAPGGAAERVTELVNL